MRAGRFVKQPSDYSAFIPSPLPPEPTIHGDDELARLLSDADRADYFQVWGNGQRYWWVAFKASTTIEAMAPKNGEAV